MFDFGFFELLVIGIVALIVVGPKDLPVMFRTIGQYTGKARAMAREFTSAMNQAADESGMRDIQKDLRNIANPKAAGLNAIKEAADEVTKWDPLAEAEATAERAAKRDAASSTEAPTEGPATAALRAQRDQEVATAKADVAARTQPVPPESNT